MGTAIVTRVVKEAEYLSNPTFEHCELIDGRIVETNVGTKPHSRIQMKCGKLLDNYFESHPGGYAATELRCRLLVRGRRCFYQPDVCAVRNDDTPDSAFLDRAPDLAIEVRSPGDSIAELMRKMDDYFANGTRLGWILLPEEKSVLILAPKQPARTAKPGESLDGGAVLPGLKIPVGKLFG
jgi:Uma2 family endonuclease